MFNTCGTARRIQHATHLWGTWKFCMYTRKQKIEFNIRFKINSYLSLDNWVIDMIMFRIRSDQFAVELRSVCILATRCCCMNLTACGQIEIWRRQFSLAHCHYQTKSKGHAHSTNWGHTQAHCAQLPRSHTHTHAHWHKQHARKSFQSSPVPLYDHFRFTLLMYSTFLSLFHFSLFDSRFLISFQSPSNRTGWLVASNWTSCDEKFSSRPQKNM